MTARFSPEPPAASHLFAEAMESSLLPRLVGAQSPAPAAQLSVRLM